MIGTGNLRAAGDEQTGGSPMKRKPFRPMIDTMEPRVALSSSNFFSTFFDNIFGQTSNSSSSQPHYTPAQIAHIKAHRQALREARQERLAEMHASRAAAMHHH